MSTVTVGVLRGGVSSEYEVSLQTGGAVLKNLPKHFGKADVLIDPEGQWHLNGWAMQPEQVFARIDVAFNALHGYYGEDGKVQKLLERHGVPYTGSRPLASAFGMNKAFAKRHFDAAGIRTPYYKILEHGDDIARAYREFPQPSIIKPLSGGSSVGIRVARTFHEFTGAAEEAFVYSSRLLLEEYIHGREGTCGILENFRGERLYALPPIEVVLPHGRDFFDFESKYGGMSRTVCPASFSHDEKEEIMDMARRAHETLGARHYSRSDFIISKRGIYILETNTLPGLTEESLLPKSCDAVGCSFTDFLNHTLSLALGGRQSV